MLYLKTFKALLRENEVLRRKIRKATGLSRTDLYRKLRNPKKFTLGEIVSIKAVLQLSMDETIHIFAPFVANYNKEEEHD